MKKRQSLLDKLLVPATAFTSIDTTIKKLSTDFSLPGFEKSMKKIKEQCESLFPKFTDLGYKARQAQFVPYNDYAIFICGQATIGKVQLEEISIKSLNTNNISDTQLKRFCLDLEHQRIYAFGKSLSKKASSLYQLFEIDINTLKPLRSHELNEPIKKLQLIEHEKKIFFVSTSGIFSIDINGEQGLGEIKKVVAGKFVGFDYANGEWVIAGHDGSIKSFTNSFESIGQVNLGARAEVVKFAKGNKRVLALVEQKFVKFSNNFQKKVVIELKATPIDLVFDLKRGLVFISTLEGKMIVISLVVDQTLYIPVHKDSIVYFWIDEGMEQIITFGKDTKIGCVHFPKILESYEIKRQATSITFCADYNQILFIDSKKFLIRWDLTTNTFETLFESNNEMSRCLSYDKTRKTILFSDLEAIYLMKYENKEIFKKIALQAKVTINSGIFSADGEQFFTVVSQNCIIFCYDVNNENLPRRLKGHLSKINCMTFISSSNLSLLVSGSNDGSIYVWDLKKNDKKVAILEGHSLGITCLSLTREQNKIISGSKDMSVKVWDWRSRLLVISLSGHNSPIVKVRVDHSNYIHSVSSDGVVICWNPRAYVKLFKYSLSHEIFDVTLSEDSRLAAYIDIDSIKLVPFQISENAFDVVGPDSHNKYEYIYYLYKILKCEIVNHEPRWDDWAVLPYQFNTLQFYSQANLYRHLRTSLHNGAGLVPSPTSDPFSVVTYKRFDRSIKAIFESTKSLLDRNSYCLSFIDHKVIVELNRLGHSHLPLFYEQMFRKYSKDDFPKFIDKKLLPIIKFSKSLYPNCEEFFGRKMEKSSDLNDPESALKTKNSQGTSFAFLKGDGGDVEEVPVSMYVSSIRMFYQNGTKESIEFLMSLIQGHNKEIFRTKFIQTLLDFKWKRLRKFQIIQAAAYFAYLASLSIYLILFNKGVIEGELERTHDDSDVVPFIVLISIAFLLSSYDIWQMYTNFEFFWKDIWNYLDLARLLTIIVYTIFFFTNFAIEKQNEMMAIIAFISFMRGIAFLRIYDDTRYLIQLIQNIIVDIKSFAIILTYSTFSFSVIDMVQSNNTQGYSSFLKQAFMVNLGEINIDGNKSGLTWIILALMGILNLIILLNMLISIMGDTFSRTKENSEIANYEEIAQMVLEIETASISQRTASKKSYLQLCEVDTSASMMNNSERDIKKIKKYLKVITSKLVKE